MPPILTYTLKGLWALGIAALTVVGAIVAMESHNELSWFVSGVGLPLVGTVIALAPFAPMKWEVA